MERFTKKCRNKGCFSKTSAKNGICERCTNEASIKAISLLAKLKYRQHRTKLIFFDTETTGIDPYLHGMHQLAGEIVIDGEVVAKFDYRINPFKGCKIDNEALNVSHTNVLDFRKYNQEFQVLYMLTNLLLDYKSYSNNNDKFYLVGWRAPEFDVKFLKAFFDRNSSLGTFDSFFWSNPIDVKTLATQHLIDERPFMESFSLAPVAKYLDIEVDESKLHSAAYDAYLGRKVYEKVK
ncbi:3'-5' exonuclease [Dysgonomonas sp. GY617]|uniref:3'-5' exonuclease n=1 Tax=Dysgonomonas sp. GY617 TaxID=2780420 RepID=UPI001883CEFC|nr:3'-5' exonuclease [Dysgonomonas sp. GY617]MBF0577714.1 3'-5' exonuclease [Dysgonomonas sp. GY617]